MRERKGFLKRRLNEKELLDLVSMLDKELSKQLKDRVIAGANTIVVLDYDEETGVLNASVQVEVEQRVKGARGPEERAERIIVSARRVLEEGLRHVVEKVSGDTKEEGEREATGYNAQVR